MSGIRVFFETKSGTRYEIDQLVGAIRRVPPPEEVSTKRGDGEWLRFHNAQIPPITPGASVYMLLESLADRGADDYGTENPHPAVTTRITSPVTRIWEATT